MPASYARPFRNLAACLTIASVAGACGGGTVEAKALADACQQSTNLGEEICSCMGEKAHDELPADSRAFLLATLEEDDAAIAEARGRLSLEEAMQAGMFMTNVSSCVPRPAEAGSE